VLGPSASGVRGVVGERPVFAFSSGMGDGCYAGYWAIDAHGAPVAFFLDFDLLTTDEVVDVVLPQPLSRGAQHHPVLADAKVSVRVPWLDRERLVVEPGRSTRAYARWRGDDGLFRRLRAVSRKSGAIELDLADRPGGATLVVRVVVRSVPMRRV
jgi:hypothetical protein